MHKTLKEFLLYTLEKAHEGIESTDSLSFAQLMLSPIPYAGIGILDWILRMDDKHPCPFCGESLVFPIQYRSREHRCHGTECSDRPPALREMFPDGFRVYKGVGFGDYPVLYLVDRDGDRLGFTGKDVYVYRTRGPQDKFTDYLIWLCEFIAMTKGGESKWLGLW